MTKSGGYTPWIYKAGEAYSLRPTALIEGDDPLLTLDGTINGAGGTVISRLAIDTDNGGEGYFEVLGNQTLNTIGRLGGTPSDVYLLSTDYPLNIFTTISGSGTNTPDMNLYTNGASGSYTSGNISLTTGDTVNGDAGNLLLTTGVASGSGASGKIGINEASPQQIIHSTTTGTNNNIFRFEYDDDVNAGIEMSFGSTVEAQVVWDHGNEALNIFSSNATALIQLFVDGKGFSISKTAAMSTNIVNYETLVISDDDIPNKKYVDDTVSGIKYWDRTGTVLTTSTAGDTLQFDADQVLNFDSGTGDVYIVHDSGANELQIANQNGNLLIDADNVLTINGDGGIDMDAGQNAPITLDTASALGGNNSGIITLTTGNTVDGNAGDISIIGGTASGTGDDADILFQSRDIASPIPFSQTGTTGLVGFTATAIVDALNEVRAAVTSEDTWDRDLINGYTYLKNATDKVGIGTSSPVFQLDIRAQGASDEEYIYMQGNNIGVMKIGYNGGESIIDFDPNGDGNDLVFKRSDAGVDVLRLDETNLATFKGDVLIQKSSPLLTLDGADGGTVKASLSGDLNLGGEDIIISFEDLGSVVGTVEMNDSAMSITAKGSRTIELVTNALTDNNTGSVTVGSGTSLGTGDSGDVELRSGIASGTGNTGDITIRTGAAASGTTGNIILETGAAGTTPGYISFETDNVEVARISNTDNRLLNKTIIGEDDTPLTLFHIKDGESDASLFSSDVYSLIESDGPAFLQIAFGEDQSGGFIIGDKNGEDYFQMKCDISADEWEFKQSGAIVCTMSSSNFAVNPTLGSVGFYVGGGSVLYNLFRCDVTTNDVSIGKAAAADASAILDVESTTRGFLPPRMTTAQRTAIGSPASGLMVYDTDLNQWFGYNGTSWVILG